MEPVSHGLTCGFIDLPIWTKVVKVCKRYTSSVKKLMLNAVCQQTSMSLNRIQFLTYCTAPSIGFTFWKFNIDTEHRGLEKVIRLSYSFWIVFRFDAFTQLKSIVVVMASTITNTDCQWFIETRGWTYLKPYEYLLKHRQQIRL